MLALNLALATLAAPAPVRDVTYTPIIQTDLAAAEQYWHRPAGDPLCSAITVTVQPMQPGVGNDGQRQAAPIILAQAPIDGCRVTISPALWTGIYLPVHTGNATWDRFSDYQGDEIGCVVMLHEYAHLIGYADTADGPAILNQDLSSVPPPRACRKAWARVRPPDSLRG